MFYTTLYIKKNNNNTLMHVMHVMHVKKKMNISMRKIKS